MRQKKIDCRLKEPSPGTSLPSHAQARLAPALPGNDGCDDYDLQGFVPPAWQDIEPPEYLDDLPDLCGTDDDIRRVYREKIDARHPDDWE